MPAPDANGAIAAGVIDVLKNVSRRPIEPMRVLNFVIAETVGDVIIHQPDGLHESIANGGADKLEAALLQILAHRVRFRGARNLGTAGAEAELANISRGAVERRAWRGE